MDIIVIYLQCNIYVEPNKGTGQKDISRIDMNQSIDRQLEEEKRISMVTDSMRCTTLNT